MGSRENCGCPGQMDMDADNVCVRSIIFVATVRDLGKIFCRYVCSGRVRFNYLTFDF